MSIHACHWTNTTVSQRHMVGIQRTSLAASSPVHSRAVKATEGGCDAPTRTKSNGTYQLTCSFKKDFQNQTLRPVTIKQILDAEETYSDAKFTIDNEPTSQVTIVGQVLRVNPGTTIVTYRVDDGTGQIDVQRWIPPDKQDQPFETFEADSFIRVHGIIKASSNRRALNADSVRQVTDFNEVNYHMLEATYVHLQLTRGPAGQNGAAGDGDSMFVDGGGYSNTALGGGNAGLVPNKLSGCSAGAKKMFNLMNNTPGGNEGMNLHMITSPLGMSSREVLAAADELLGQGLVYTTVDDETWAILEY
ncbi:hypothetical protein S7711_05676 [Stachybotrys chartarum IBT 7711]|uniref:Replication protein A C-terminal domain-containing protein n=1 Tax=Stachybotrys chartarum (strain CBS 109288 / IBT 7711) TaxID=1280523 RepID=A0A084B1I5_STACB|nr:hypothetical protein S7711_05676 [Stachybotrys chartarum IBT 7711]KFA48130.1 hypothetical protein S40293_08879 [Stachybotrys chartarum IBT 40293]KFA75105.1 hypothetical protein S40288_04023 [Stachybotrys chartarum IBT 40288]